MSRSMIAAGMAGAALVTGAAVFAAEETAPAPAVGLRAQGAALPPLTRETPRDAPGANEAIDAELAKLRLREGTRLSDVSGRFRQNGDSLLFIDAENREICGLPNLNLERIIRLLKSVEEPESVVWSVSGVVTEFSGRNYLLISRAVYKAASPRRLRKVSPTSRPRPSSAVLRPLRLRPRRTAGTARNDGAAQRREARSAA